jgi:LmeA-like phospholipid-binding
MTTTDTPARPAPRKRRSKTVRRLVITLVVLIGLLVVADFSAAAVFEYQVSKRARDQFDLSDDPSVKVGGFSFLAQAVSGEYGHVTIDAKGVPVEDTLRDLEVHIELRDVQAPLGDLVSGSLQEVKVREVEGQVKVKASDVNRAIANNKNNLIKSITNVTIDPVSEQDVLTDPDERTDAEQEAAERAAEAEIEDTTAGAKICATVDFAGEDTELCAFGIISLVEGAKMTFTPSRIAVSNSVLGNGQLPPTWDAAVKQKLTFTLDPGKLPFTVTPTVVTVDPGVLSVKGIANDVVLGSA